MYDFPEKQKTNNKWVYQRKTNYAMYDFPEKWKTNIK